MTYRTASLACLGLAVFGLAGWIAARFMGPILGISYEGFLLFTNTSLWFAIAISLFKMAFEAKKDR
jgi:hypothetical protein